MKTNNKIICDAELISRYLDDELEKDESVRVKTHIAGCESCRSRLSDYGKIGADLNSLILAQPGASTGLVEDKVLESIRRKNNTGLKGWKDVILSKRMMVPVGLAASIMLMFLTFFNNPAPVGPTAIVSSFSGSGSSVVILETSETRQTIIWFGENG
ncbi:MAG: zf-HC2 domain-containing protein [Desulfobacteraceae bacterium]